MDLLRVYFDTQRVTLELDISLWLVFLAAVLVVVGIVVHRHVRRYRLVKLNISLGGIGSVEIRPNNDDLQIAHRIWTELVTRKAAIRVDPRHDLIVEVYDSWYSLFTRVRELIGDLPADLVRRDKSTREVVRIATTTLNDGLRPHLTLWQARFRNWWEANQGWLKEICPQDLQRDFPEFDELIDDLLRVNSQLMAYASELKKLRDG